MTDPNQQILYPLLVRFAKVGFMRFIGHLDWQAMQHAIFIRAGLPVGISEGFSHRLKIKTSPPTPVGVSSNAEFTYILLSEPIYPEEALRRINSTCPEGIVAIAGKDAGFMVRKNPFGTIEATEYEVDFGDGITDENLRQISVVFDSMKSEPDNPGDEELKPFWGRVLESELNGDKAHLLVKQMEGDTFHAAKCATYMEEKLDLPHYPIFTKLDYYRLKAGKRKLFR